MVVDQLAGALLRRGLSATAAHLAKRDDEPVESEPVFPTWGLAIIWITAIGFFFFMASIQYTIKEVIGTLTMVENPTATAAVTVSVPKDVEDAAEKDGLLETEVPTITLVQTKPVTSKIRTTLHHLTARAGRYSRWRGLAPFVVYTGATGFITNLLDAVLPQALPLRLVIIGTAVSVLLVPIHAAWVHAVIAMPSDKRWTKRIPQGAWKKLAVPAAVNALASFAALYACTGVAALLATMRPIAPVRSQEATGGEIAAAVLAGLVFIATVVAIVLSVVIPAHVTLVRVEASLLPEEEETIVPFDRSFGGKVVPAILGGSGAISFKDAWHSFGCEARRRVLKLYGKYFAISAALGLLMVHVLLFEAWAIAGPALGKALSEASQNMRI